MQCNAVLSVLTDTLHKAGFKLQQQIFSQLILAVETGLLNEVTLVQFSKHVANKGLFCGPECRFFRVLLAVRVSSQNTRGPAAGP